MSESSSSGTSNLFVNVKEISVFADCAVTMSSPLTGAVSPNVKTNYLHFKNPPHKLTGDNWSRVTTDTELHCSSLKWVL